jgi:ubiquinone/menaquinone biosynthesis C-methylase UbiE
MVTAAKKAYPDICFLQANTEALQFPDRSFDVAVVNYSAHLLASPKEVFGEICRVLEPGGRLTVAHPVQANRTRLADLGATCSERPLSALITEMCMAQHWSEMDPIRLLHST